jgi:hypothetical protein
MPERADWFPGRELAGAVPPDTTTEQCLQCRRHAEGRAYSFYVGAVEGHAFEVIHQEAVFVCNRCALACLELSPAKLRTKRFVLALGGAQTQVTIAAQACLMLLGQEHDYFSRVQSILVYPSAFQVTDEASAQAG